jgi:hypothetical protein
MLPPPKIMYSKEKKRKGDESDHLIFIGNYRDSNLFYMLPKDVH